MSGVKVTIIGKKVHGVGYRLFLLEEADALFISNFDVKNVKTDGKQAVVAMAEGSEDQIKEFTGFCESNFPEEAEVGDVSAEEYEGKIRSIDSFRNSFSVNQLSKIARTGVAMLGKQDSMLDKQDSMLGKQDALKTTVQDGFTDLKGTVEGGFSELKEEHIKTRNASIEIFHSEVQELRQELNSLRSSIEEIRKKVGIT